jgi:hypothetical protein
MNVMAVCAWNARVCAKRGACARYVRGFKAGEIGGNVEAKELKNTTSLTALCCGWI